MKFFNLKICFITILMVLFSKLLLATETTEPKEDCYDRSFSFYKNKNFKKAIECLEKSIEQYPLDAKNFYALGGIYYEKKEYTYAIENFTKALLLEPDFKAQILYMRGSAYFRMGEYEKAIDDYSDAIKNDPGYENAYNNRGNAFLFLEKFEEAILDYSKVIEINPKTTKGYYNKGFALYRLKQYEEAMTYYSKAMEIDSNDIAAYYGRGQCFYDMGNYNEAFDNFDKVIELDDTFKGVYNDRGNVFFQQGKYDKALSDYNKAIQLNPDEISSFYNRGDLWKIKGEYGRAINDYKKVIERESENVMANNALAWLYATCKDASVRDAKEALKYAKKAVEIKRVYKTLDTLAAAYAEDGQFEKAVEIQKEAISLIEKKEDIKRYKERLELYKQGKPYIDRDDTKE